MTIALSLFAGLLQAALALLGFVQTHPDLPQPLHDQAVQAAQQVVTQTTHAIPKQQAIPQATNTKSTFRAYEDTPGTAYFFYNLHDKYQPSGGAKDSNMYTIDFGDGTSAPITPIGSFTDACPTGSVNPCTTPALQVIAWHTYSSSGTFKAKLQLSSTGADIADLTINITGGTPSSSDSVPGMSKYTDADFGFSFWYPSGWKVTKMQTSDAWVQTEGGTVAAVLGIGKTNPEIKIEEVISSGMTITDTGGGGPLGSISYWFDTNEHAWMTTKNTGGLAGGAGANNAFADVRKNTMGGLHMLSGTSRFDTSVIPLSAHNFVIVNDGGGVNAGYLAPTIVATDPSVATPLSAAEQIKTIQAEKDAYATSQ